MKRQARQYKALLETGRWFGGISESFRERLLAAAIVRELPQGHRLFSRGDPPCGLYGVVDGAVRITGAGEGGKEALLMMAEPPTWFGEISVFDGLHLTHDAIINGEAILLHVPLRPLQALLDEEPARWKELGMLLASKIRLALDVMEDYALVPLPTRLARRLVMISDSYGELYDRRRTVVTMKQEELALMLATSRQTINHVLKDMESRGLIRVTYGEITILDLSRLRALGTGSSDR